MYKPGDVVMVRGHESPVTITKIVSETGIIGYAGTYINYYNDKPIMMELAWIPHRQCTPLIVSA